MYIRNNNSGNRLVLLEIFLNRRVKYRQLISGDELRKMFGHMRDKTNGQCRILLIRAMIFVSP